MSIQLLETLQTSQYKYFYTIWNQHSYLFSIKAFASQKVMHVLGSTLAEHCQKVQYANIVMDHELVPQL